MEKCHREEIIEEMQREHKELQNRLNKGELVFQSIHSSLKGIEGTLKDHGEKLDSNREATIKLEQRLFVDNGKKSHQTLLNEYGTAIDGFKENHRWIRNAITTLAIGMSVGIIAIIIEFILTHI